MICAKRDYECPTAALIPIHDLLNRNETLHAKRLNCSKRIWSQQPIVDSKLLEIRNILSDPKRLEPSAIETLVRN